MLRMGFRANKAYLQDELQRRQERLELVSEYLNGNPSISLQKRIIKGKAYFYERFRVGEKSTSKFFSKCLAEAEARRVELEEASVLRKKLKAEKRALQEEVSLLERQLKLVDKGIHLYAG